MIQKFLLGVFKFPVIRHLLAGVLIVGLLYFFSIAPLQSRNAKLQGYILQLAKNQQKLIENIAKEPTYKVENRVNAKIKKGGEIKLTPETEMKVSNVSVQVLKDSIKEKERTWMGRQLYKIGNFFRKKDEVSSSNKVERAD